MSSNVIAIDGPCYAGKSTIALALARLTGYTYINTGHMYRAVAKEALQQGISLTNTEVIISIAEGLSICFEQQGDSCRTIVNGKDLTDSLDSLQISSGAAQIAPYSGLRRVLTDMQRSYAGGEKPVIFEGRDIGLVVFVDAVWKFFITASVEVRAERMKKILMKIQNESLPDMTTLMATIDERDERDQKREIAPLKMANDAILYDNSDSPSAAQDALILQYYVNHISEIVRNAPFLKNKFKF
jgi:cytidylate kinase|tara:strand:- start:518 stop:1243 length:726 start_codon:yes stop_codon:yes gene_type:complete